MKGLEIFMDEMNQKLDEKYMREAIRQAKKAYALEEVPIGWPTDFRSR